MKIFDYDDCWQRTGKWPWDYTKETSPEDKGLAPILETDKEFEDGYILIINGISYRNVFMTKDNRVPQCTYVEKLKQQSVFTSDSDVRSTDLMPGVTCPYCGAEYGDCYPDSDNFICDECGSVFSHKRAVIYKYQSYPIKKHEPIVLD